MFILCDYLFSKNPYLARYYKPDFYILKNRVALVNFESARVLDYYDLPYETVSNKQYLEAQQNIITFMNNLEKKRLIVIKSYESLTLSLCGLSEKYVESLIPFNCWALFIGLSLDNIELLKNHSNRIKFSEEKEEKIYLWKMKAKHLVFVVRTYDNIYLDVKFSASLHEHFVEFYNNFISSKLLNKIKRNNEQTNEKHHDKILTYLVMYLPVIREFMKAFYYMYLKLYYNMLAFSKEEHEHFWSYRFIQKELAAFMQDVILNENRMIRLIESLHEFRNCREDEETPGNFLSRKEIVYLYKLIVYLKTYYKMINKYGCTFNNDGVLNNPEYDDFLYLIFYRENKEYFYKYFSKKANFEKYFKQYLDLRPLPKIILFKPKKDPITGKPVLDIKEHPILDSNKSEKSENDKKTQPDDDK